MTIVSFREIENVKFGPIVRLYISGSSGSGKTHFINMFLESKLFKYTRVYYYHPDFHESEPVDWHSSLSCEVVYKSEPPTIDSFMSMKPFSVIVLDDIFDKVESSYDVDFLFRVLSGKRKLHVIVMAQRYFSNGKFCVSIRNCCDYHVLMRNSDLATTKRIGRTLGHEKEILQALKLTEDKLYPYIFVDKTHLARVNKIQVYIDVFSPIKVVVYGSMKYYLLNEKDFTSTYKIIDAGLAENEVKKQRICRSTDSSSAKTNTTTTNTNTSTIKFTPIQRQHIESQVKRTLHRYKKRSQL